VIRDKSISPNLAPFPHLTSRGRLFPLQARADFGTFGDVRMLAPLMTLLIGVCTAGAQTQEKKLVDRLLRPDTSMVNAAQQKQFAARGGLWFEKRVPARSFYSTRKTLTKAFSSKRALTPPQIAARHFRLDDSPANLPVQTELAQKNKIIRPRSAPGIRVAAESTAAVPVRQFSRQRPFLGRGKSQKALQAYNRPLSIEQVRELLNKSR
jgi:hypothetical protein